MKKLFTFIATALVAMAANAQVSFDGSEDTSAGFTKGDVAVAFVSDTYTFKTDAKSCDDITFAGYFAGAANPKVDGTNYTAGAGTPGTGSVIKLTPASSGTLNVYVYVNAGKSIYVLEDGKEINFSVNGNAVEPGATLDVKGQPAPISFAATAGKTYAVFCAGSKMGYYGYNLVAGGGTTLTIDDICGSYKSAYSYGLSSYEGGKYYTGYTQNGVIISKISADSVMITNLAGSYQTGYGKFDGAARTITMNGLYQYDAETVASTIEKNPAVAVINEDGTITINYAYTAKSGIYGYKEVLTPAKEPKKVWEVTGTLDYLNSADDSKLKSIAATLTKWENNDYDYELTYGDPSYGYANPSTIQFNVNTDGTWTLVNGYYPGETTPTAWYYYPFADCYDLKIYTGSYSSFSGTQESGEAYAWYYWYNTKDSENSDVSGYLDFNWGSTEGIQNVTTTSAASTRKCISNGRLVIMNNGRQYNAAGQLMK